MIWKTLLGDVIKVNSQNSMFTIFYAIFSINLNVAIVIVTAC